MARVVNVFVCPQHERLRGHRRPGDSRVVEVQLRRLAVVPSGSSSVHTGARAVPLLKYFFALLVSSSSLPGSDPRPVALTPATDVVTTAVTAALAAGSAWSSSPASPLEHVTAVECDRVDGGGPAATVTLHPAVPMLAADQRRLLPCASAALNVSAGWSLEAMVNVPLSVTFVPVVAV